MLIREQVNNQRANNIPLYKCSQLSQEILGKELHLFPVGKISNWIIEMASNRKPVHFDEVARRLADAAGTRGVGSR